eukprot:Rmarinus@m.25705
MVVTRSQLRPPSPKIQEETPSKTGQAENDKENFRPSARKRATFPQNRHKTLARRRELREVLRQRNANYEDDFLNSPNTPIRAVTRIPSCTSRSELMCTTKKTRGRQFSNQNTPAQDDRLSTMKSPRSTRAKRSTSSVKIACSEEVVSGRDSVDHNDVTPARERVMYNLFMRPPPTPSTPVSDAEQLYNDVDDRQGHSIVSPPGIGFEVDRCSADAYVHHLQKRKRGADSREVSRRRRTSSKAWVNVSPLQRAVCLVSKKYEEAKNLHDDLETDLIDSGHDDLQDIQTELRLHLIEHEDNDDDAFEDIEQHVRASVSL